MKHFHGRISKKIRLTAILTLFCFLAQTAAWDHSVSALPDTVKPAFDFPGKISIPSALGTVETQNLQPQSGKPLVIYVQDAHAVTGAQASIRKLIAYFQQTYHISLVALEGGTGSLDPLLLQSFPVKPLRGKVMRDYFEKGEMTGAEMAAVLNPQPARYEGIEDWELYESNYRAYLEAMQNKAGLLKKIGQIQARLDEERASVYSVDQNNYYKLTADFYADPASFSKLLDYLNQTEARREKTRVYPRLKTLIDALRDEGTLETPLQQAAEKFKMSFLTKLNSEDQKIFQKKSQAFLTGKMPPFSFLAFLDAFARKRKLPLDLVPSLRDARQNARAFYAVKGTQAFEELESCLLKIEKDLFVSTQSKKLLEQYRRLRMLKQLVSLELSRKQWESLRDDSKSLMEIRNSKENIAPAVNFYNGALARDRALHGNLEKIISKYKAPAVMVIAGGFHRQGFEQALKDSGYSFAVVTPCMKSLEGQERYDALMQGKVSWGGEIRDSLYDAFSRHSVKKLAAGLNPLEFSREMKNWRDQIIRSLAAENRLDQAGQYTKYIDEILQPEPDKEKIRKVVSEVLRKYQSQTQESLWRGFEKQFGAFSAGMEKLKMEKKLTAENIRGLMLSAEKPSFLGMDIQKLNPKARFSQQSIVFAAHRLQGDKNLLRAELHTYVHDEAVERHEIRTENETDGVEEDDEWNDEFSSFERSLEDLHLLHRLWEGKNAEQYDELKALIHRYAAVRGMRGTIIRMMKAFVNGKMTSFNEVAGEIFAAARLQEHLSAQYETEVLGFGFNVGSREFDIFLKVSRKKNARITTPILEDGLYLVEAKEDAANHFYPLIQSTIEKQVVPQQRYASMLAAAGVPVKGFIVAVGGPMSGQDKSQKPGVLKREPKSSKVFWQVYSMVLDSFDVQNSRVSASLPQTENSSVQGHPKLNGNPFMMYAAQWVTYLLGTVLKKTEALQPVVSQPPARISEEQMRLWAEQKAGILTIFKYVLNPAFQIWPKLHEFKTRAKGEEIAENEKLIGRAAAHILDTLQRLEGQRLKMVLKIMRQKEVRRKQLAQELEKRESEADGWEDVFRAHNLEDPDLAENPDFLKEVLRAYFSNRGVPLPLLRKDLQEHYWTEEDGESGPEKIRNAAGAWEWLKKSFREFQAAEEERKARKSAAEEGKRAKRFHPTTPRAPKTPKINVRSRRASIVREFTKSILDSFKAVRAAGALAVGMEIPEKDPEILEVYRVLSKFLDQTSVHVGETDLSFVHPVYSHPVVFNIATALQSVYFPRGRARAGKNPKDRSAFDWFYTWPILQQEFGRRPRETGNAGPERAELREVLFSNVPLDDLDKLNEVFHAMSAGQEMTFMKDTLKIHEAPANRIFVEDPFGRRLRQWPLDFIFPAHVKYNQLLQMDHLSEKHYSKELRSFQENLQEAAQDFLKPAGFNVKPGQMHLSIAKETAADGGPHFHITFDMPPVVPGLTGEDFLKIQEPQKHAFQEALEFFYPFLWYGGHFNTSQADREAAREEQIADRHPDQQWEFYYDAALKRIGETAAWIRTASMSKEEKAPMILETQRLLNFAVRDLENVQKHLPFESHEMALRIKQIHLLMDDAAGLMEILFDKYRNPGDKRHEIRTQETVFELPDDKLRSEIEKTFVPLDLLREKNLVVRVPVFLFQEETAAEDLDNFDVDSWEELMYQKKIGQRWDEYIVRLDTHGNPQALYQPADTQHYGPVLWTYPEEQPEAEDPGLTVPDGKRSWEKAAEIKRWRGLVERLPQKKLDEDFREDLRRHFEDIIADLQGIPVLSVQRDSGGEGIWIQRLTRQEQKDPYELQLAPRAEIRSARKSQRAGDLLMLLLPPADTILRNPDSAAIKRQARLKMEQMLSSGFQKFERRIESAGDLKFVNPARLREWGDEAFGNWAAAVDTKKLADQVAKSLKETGDFQIASEVLRRVKAVLDHPEYFSEKGEPLFSENSNAVLESELLFAFGDPEEDETIRQELLQAYRWTGILYPVGDREPRLRKLTAGAGDRLALFPYKEGEESAKKISQKDLERGRETPVTVSLKGTPFVFTSQKAAREKFKNRGVALDLETVHRLRALGFNFRQILTLMKIYTSPGILRRQLEDRPDAFPELTPEALKTGLETLASLWTRDLENLQHVQAAA